MSKSLADRLKTYASVKDPLEISMEFKKRPKPTFTNSCLNCGSDCGDCLWNTVSVIWKEGIITEESICPRCSKDFREADKIHYKGRSRLVKFAEPVTNFLEGVDKKV